MSPAVTRQLRFVAFASLLVCASAHAEKKIYACKDAAGNAIFSSQPCGPDARELRVDAGSSAPVQGSAEQAPQPQQSSPAAASDLPASPTMPDAAAQAACRDEASRAATYPSEEQLRLLEMQRTSVINAIAHGEANEAQAAEIEAAIEREQSRIAAAKRAADTAVRDAMAACSKPRSDRDRAGAEH